MKKIQIGLLGLGTVGSGVWKILHERRALLRERAGVDLQIKKILVKHRNKKRTVSVPRRLLTDDISQILNDPEIQIVVEVMGGEGASLRAVLGAIRRGKHLITANKTLLANEGHKIFKEADRRQVSVGFEASVAGGIPIIKSIREGFVGNHIQEVYGIINGTSNYILSQMTERGASFEEVLCEAQQKGYAERNPYKDISGEDAAEKLLLLISLCYGGWFSMKNIYVEGIHRITPFDIQSAGELGFVIKLLAIAKGEDSRVQARVHPVLVPKSHPLADVSGAFNAIFLKGDAIGPAMFYGRGAGMMPTASAVVSDIVDIAKSIDCCEARITPSLHSLAVESVDKSSNEYYFRFTVFDRPGVLGQIANCLGKNRISIASVHQREQVKGGKVPILVVTHKANEKDVQKAIHEIDRLSVVAGKTMMIRMERF
ncbi:MAG: homoserine dehydrogenase [Deltaproteobacteria bacterium]|nr:homoserine dehydrogenase [Deltaproteobacteria bacterium]